MNLTFSSPTSGSSHSASGPSASSSDSSASSSGSPASLQPPGYTTTWWIKLLDCLFVSIALVDSFDSLVLYPAIYLPFLSKYKAVAYLINLILTVAAILFAIIYPIYWHRREKRGISDSGLRHAWFTGIIRYWIAVLIFNYGFAKILGTQFAHNYFRGDSTWNSLSGFDLTWNYFSYSYTMATIIAGIQILGAAFLLFRRTTMLGILFLLPVMVNIVLIDFFYSIPMGALMNAIMFTAGLTYLLLLQWPAIKKFFTESLPELPVIRMGGIKNGVRLGLIIFAFTGIYCFAATKAPASLTGKWKVDQLIRNGDTAKINDWLNDRYSWNNIYLEKFGRVTFSANPYVIEDGRSLVGMYKYDGTKQNIRLIVKDFVSYTDTSYAMVTMGTPGHMQWTIVHEKDTTSLQLSKVSGEKVR